MNFASKRKRDEAGAEHTKKTRSGEEMAQEYSTSDEWPIYSHPEGGIVKITPWGSLRQFKNEKGEDVTKFEDAGFEDITFHKAGPAYSAPPVPQQMPEDEYMPSTPQSLYNYQQYQQTTHQNQNQNQFNSRSSPTARGGIKLSPSDEAEMYVVDGYSEMGPGGVTPPPQNQQVQFEQEHENYFGMSDQKEEFDYSDSFIHHDADMAM